MQESITDVSVGKRRKRIMKAILFDVDDTIYDQQMVFDQACRDVFGELKGVSLVDLFKANRYYSDESFDAMGRGEMTKEEMYIYRIKRAMEEFHLPITDEQAVRYQPSESAG